MATIAAVIAAIEKVEVDIDEAGAAIKKVESDIEDITSKLGNRKFSEEDKSSFRKHLDHLYKKEQHLRTKEEQLRTEKEQLRTKEEQLRTEERRREDRKRKEEDEGDEILADYNKYIQRVRVMNGPSQVSLKREQLDPSSPLVKNWRPNTAQTVGLQPELAHPQFAAAVDTLGGAAQLDQATVNAAAKLCCIGADIYEKEVMHFNNRAGDQNTLKVTQGWPSSS
ncbi:hypothetical protein HYH02_003147 [Chlamydomonas schloesseri]|uniref:Uncharacterized protein n=1 Tax=Chlamydomonas schloesseri TaxID=2026947 RepID=A0A835WQA5_9CHLO|nr:hypothetical protein HYH02_003147 [Chlamydomonas schloesseri]|eukprot:KAG2452113.1 hypothetical protein HYH02_003147 [Chlamydomonas schloesseri]